MAAVVRLETLQLNVAVSIVPLAHPPLIDFLMDGKTTVSACIMATFVFGGHILRTVLISCYSPSFIAPYFKRRG